MTKRTHYEVLLKTTAAWTGTIDAANRRDAKRMARSSFEEGALNHCEEDISEVVVFKQRQRTGSWATFERRFGALDSPAGTVWWRRQQLPEKVDTRKVWTIVECDGKLCLLPGFHSVNCINYVLCERPWPDEELYQTGYRYA